MTAPNAFGTRHFGRIPDEHLPERPRLNPVDLRAVDYVGSYDHNLMCAICHCPFVFPVKLSCEHVFCQRCVNQAMMQQSRRSRSCPSCRTTIDQSSITPVPKILDQILDDLLVRCPLRTEGCLEEMPRGHLQDHLEKYCPVREVDCPSEDCFLLVQRKNADEARCLHYLVECEDCKESIMKQDLEHHRTLECKIGRTACPDCKRQVLVRDLEAHIEQCPDSIFPCTAAPYGCDFVARRESLDNHLKDCSLAKLMPFLKIQTDRLEAHESALRHLRHKNAILETSFATVQDTLNPSTNVLDAPSSSATTLDTGPFDSTAHHLLCLHESLREEVSRVSDAVREADAKASMLVMNESLRVKEDFAHTNAAIGGLRMQLHWLTSARLQNQQRVATAKGQTSGNGLMIGTSSAEADPGEDRTIPIRRLSDTTRQETKL